MRALRALTALAVVAALIWCAAWFVGTRLLDRAIAEGLRQAPWVSVAGHRILGFPNRFDVTFDAPRIRTEGFDWSAPFVQFFALTYRPHHLIAVLAADQRLLFDGHDWALHAQDLRASVVMAPALDLPLERTALVGQHLDLNVDGAAHGIEALRIGTRRTGDTTLDLAIVAQNVVFDTAGLDPRDTGGIWPRQFTELRFDAEAEFDRPLDRHALEGQGPRLIRLTLTGLRLAWPQTDIALAGRLTPGADGQLSGDATLTVVGWQALLERAQAAGLMTGEDQGRLAPLLGALSSAADGDRIEVPLSVIEGDVRLGPLLLGTLPPLR